VLCLKLIPRKSVVYSFSLLKKKVIETYLAAVCVTRFKPDFSDFCLLPYITLQAAFKTFISLSVVAKIFILEPGDLPQVLPLRRPFVTKVPHGGMFGSSAVFARTAAYLGSTL